MPKVIKIPFKILAVVLGIALILLAIAQTGWFKNYITKKATNYLSKELNTEVKIDKISLDYFDRLNAYNILIRDEQKDTMVFIKKLKANYNLKSFSNQLINFDKVVLDNSLINLGIYEGQSRLNIQFLIDYFTPPPSAETKESPILEFDQIKLINSKFIYFNRNFEAPKDRLFNENDMLFSNLNGSLEDFQIINDSLNFNILGLSGFEKSGLDVQTLKSKTIISRSTMAFRNLLIKTPKSTISNYLKFNYNSYNDLANFIKVVKIEATLDNAQIHTDDLALFGESLKSYNERIKGDGKLEGTIADLTSNKLNLSIGNHTHFLGYLKLKGLPSIKNTIWNVNATSLSTNATDLSRLMEIQNPPSEFLNLGDIKYQGVFKGTINKFNTKATITTDLGNIETNLDYTASSGDIATYSGKIKSDGFDLENLLSINDLSTTSFDLDVDGSGFTLETLKARVNGTINHFGLKNYNYQNISVDGTVANNIYNGGFGIDDPNFKLKLKGSLNATGDLTTIKVKSTVNKINLKTLGLDSVDTYLNFNGDINLKGNRLDQIVGRVALDSFALARANQHYLFKQVNFTSKIREKSREFSFLSDLGKIELTGDFKPSEINKITQHIAYIINPLDNQKPADSIESNNFVLNANLNRYNKIYNEYLKGIYFDSAHLNFSYISQTGKLRSENKFFRPNFDGTNSNWAGLSFSNGGEETPLNFAINTDGLNQKDSTLFDVFNAHGFITNGIVNFETTSAKDSVINIILTGRYIQQNDTSRIFLDDSEVALNGKAWTLKNTKFPNFIYSNGVAELRYFDFRNSNEILFFDASFGENSNKLNLVLTNFKLDNLMPFLAAQDTDLEGIANGYIDVSDRDGNPIIESDLVVDNLKLNGDTLGDLILTSSATEDLLVVDFNGRVEGGLLNKMNIQGDIDFGNSNSPLDLTLSTVESSIKPFEKYLTGLASNIKGFSTTNINISGPLTEPKLRGEMYIDSLDFVVDYLQTNYNGFAVVDISYNSFTLREAQIKDRFNKTGIVTGNVSHKNYGNFMFDILIDSLNSFEIMNTTRAENDLFYGTAFVDGNMAVSGPLDNILLEINAKSREGTTISIPLDYFESDGKLSYVEFVDLTADNNIINSGFSSVSGVQMDFNFEVTNDASVTLIFDELLGDKIEASGHGNLRMEINTFGDFNMYGGLTIDEGDYLFTAYDLITKYFEVSPGGTLFWDGNPYNATINLDAVIREYPNPDLLLAGVPQDDESTAATDKLPTDCHLKLKGLLFNPDVTFDLTFPNQSALNTSNNSSLNTVINRIKQDQEELNRQAFALLVLGTFVPPTFSSGSDYSVGSGAISTGINSLSDFASSQINNWLSQLDTRWQVGIDFQNFSSTTVEEKTEIMVSIRRKFFKDRIELEGSVDANNSVGIRPWDITAKVKLKKDGNFKLKLFHKNAVDPTLGNLSNIQTSGVGLYYKYQFDKFRLREKKIKPESKP